ncbi:uncharacterized protein LOC132611654 [Lycium barbarum]|uniref:uncharacterized protein LOC132611654 n=1 Tax=Lycium barbarum TaxID=112863 RepID=UPI00293E3F36|nr:uncharacterized protein LOC132611654 [Lycium barbarum]
MGFAEIFIDMVWRLIANNWYSILLNGQAYGFFHSTSGVKQGDPLSPALFILSAEVLSRALNSLFENNEFRSYGIPKWSANLNHLAYADDTIIFSSADARSLELIMELGCPVTHSRKRKVDYNDLIKKVKNRLQTWKGRMLSFGGKSVLINNGLMSMPIHLLPAIKPPKCVINDMHKIFSSFFWNNSEEGRRRHWSSCLNLCKQKEEGGVGFRSLFDDNKYSMGKLYVDQILQKAQSSDCAVKGRFSNEGVQDVKELMLQDGWNIGRLQQLFPMDIVDHILEELHFHEPKEEWDRLRWMMTASGKFIVGTAWELLGSKAAKSDVFKNMWTSGVPFKILLFLEVVEVQNTSWRGNIATKVWTYVKTVVGITTQFQQVRQILHVWWNADCPSKFRTIFKAIPMVTM